jgi:diadenosine tetraphosphate (Ap4A) HIT family hydrolase
MNPTMAKFGHPETLVADYRNWVVLLRRQQVTLGALVLVCQEEVTAFSQVSPAAFAELATVVRDIEAALTAAFAYDKINYLMLMMLDPNVHFHVIPRYAEERSFDGQRFPDTGWPRLPDLAPVPHLEAATLTRLRDHMKQLWVRHPVRHAGRLEE